MKEYNLEQAAAFLNVKPDTVLDYIRSGELDAEKIGDHYKITDEDLSLFKQLKAKGVVARHDHRCKGEE